MRAPLLLMGLLSTLSCKSEPKPEEKKDEPAAALAALENEDAKIPERPLVAGDVVSDFTALAHTGQRFRLSEFLERPALVYLCPTDRTPECTALALALRDEWLLLNPSLSMAFGVSGDDTFVHRDFASEHELPHLLIADGDQHVHRMFGLALGTVSAHLVGTDRKILRVWNPVDPTQWIEQVRAALAELGLARPSPPI